MYVCCGWSLDVNILPSTAGALGSARSSLRSGRSYRLWLAAWRSWHGGDGRSSCLRVFHSVSPELACSIGDNMLSDATDCGYKLLRSVLFGTQIQGNDENISSQLELILRRLLFVATV